MLFVAEIFDHIFVPRILVDAQDEGFDGWVAFDEGAWTLRQLLNVAWHENTSNAPGTAFTMMLEGRVMGV